MKTIKQLFILLIPCSVFISCIKADFKQDIKNDIQIETFLKSGAAASPELTVIKNDLRRQLYNRNFITNFVEWHGNPQWEKLIKLKKTNKGCTTLAIPTYKNGVLSAFFAATITPDNKVLFEMHRVSILNTLLKEYSYIGIDKAVSKYYLSVFNGDKTFLTGTENENIMDPCEFCWYEWELCPEETFTTTKDSTAINNVSVPHDPPPHCWIEHCETECMPGGGGGNGGGGGGGCPTCPPPPQCDDPLWYSFVPEEDPCEPPPPGGQDTILNPCNQILLLQNNQGFKDMLQILKNHADNPNDTTEHGFVYNYLPNNLSVDAYDGIPGEKHIDLKFEGMTGDGTAHNHFINSLSIFSPQDLWGIATIFNEKLMADSSTFTMALVTASNTQYLMMIENITKFRHWAQRITIGNLEVYKRLYTFIYKISETNTIADNELRFLKFLKDDSGGTGLKLFRGNANFAQWTPLMLDGNNNVITGTCQ